MRESSIEKRSPKTPSLTAIRDGVIYRVNVPASSSPTGQRQRLKFKTKRAADLEIERIKSMAKKWGSDSTKLSAAEAEDAAKALDVLKGFDISLSAAVSEWVAMRKAQDASVTLQALVEAYTADKLAEGISAVYARDIERFFRPFLRELGGRLVCDITHTEIKEVLATFPTTRQRANVYRTVRPAFTMALTEGYASENIFDRIKTPKHRSRDPESLTVPEVKAVFNACADYTGREDLIKDYRVNAEDAATPFALMAFAGIRPEEINRLQWSAVHIEERTIIIDGDVAKTRSHRIIPMAENLVAWLELVPESEREGNVTPPNWAKKYQAVRKVSNIGTRQQDILRHTFASAHLAAHTNLNDLQGAMGHGTSEMILKHYKSLMPKSESVKFWSIAPNGTQAQLKAVS